MAAQRRNSPNGFTISLSLGVTRWLGRLAQKMVSHHGHVFNVVAFLNGARNGNAIGKMCVGVATNVVPKNNAELFHYPLGSASAAHFIHTSRLLSS